MAQIPCSIKVHSRQVMGHDRDETIEEYEGAFMDRADKKYLSYKRDDGECHCSVLLCFTGDRLVLKQQGDINSVMEFQAGKKTVNEYGTPAGKLMLSLFTRELEIWQGKDNIDILMDYDLITGGEPIQNRMHITASFR